MGLYDQFQKETKTSSGGLYQQYQDSINPKPSAFSQFAGNVVGGAKTIWNDVFNAPQQVEQPTPQPFTEKTPSVGGDIALTALNTYANTLKDAKDRMNAWSKVAGDHHATTLDKGIAAGTAGMGALQTFFAPIMAVSIGAEKVPVLGGVAKGINKIFGAVGTVGADVLEGFAQQLNVSQETRDKITPLAREIGALGSQIVLGAKGGKVFDSLAKKSSQFIDEVNSGLYVAKNAVEKGIPQKLPVAGESVTQPVSFFNQYQAEQALPTIQMGVKPKDTLPVAARSPLEAPVAPESAPTAPITGETYYHATSAENAKSIAESGFKAQIGERSLGVANAKGVWLYEDKSATTEFGKNFIRAGKTPAVVETKVNGKIFDATSEDRSIRAIVEDKTLMAKLRAEGYVGVKGDELGTSATFIFDTKALAPITPKVENVVPDSKLAAGFDSVLDIPLAKPAQEMSLAEFKKQNGFYFEGDTSKNYFKGTADEFYKAVQDAKTTSYPLAQEAQKYKSAEEAIKGIVEKNPNVQYHGSVSNIKEFTLGNESVSGAGTSDFGVFLTSDPNVAELFAEFGGGGKAIDRNIYAVLLKTKIKDMGTDNNMISFIKENELNDFSGVKKLLQEQGYGGVKYERTSGIPANALGNLETGTKDALHTETVVFNPKDIEILGVSKGAGHYNIQPEDFKPSSQLTDFWEKNNKVTKPVESAPVAKSTPESRVVPLNETQKTVTPQKTGEVTKAASDINATLVKQGYEALSPELQSKYTPESYKAELVKAKDLAETNYEDAVARATGKKPVGDYEAQILFNEVERIATENGDYQTLLDLAASPLGKKLSEAAQTLGAAGFNDNPNSPVEAIRAVQEARTKALERKGTDIKKETTKDATTFKSEIKASRSSRQSWSEFAKQIICNI